MATRGPTITLVQRSLWCQHGTKTTVPDKKTRHKTLVFKPVFLSLANNRRYIDLHGDRSADEHRTFPILFSHMSDKPHDANKKQEFCKDFVVEQKKR